MSECQWVEGQMRGVLEKKTFKTLGSWIVKNSMEAEERQLLVTHGALSVRVSEMAHSHTVRSQCRTGQSNQKSKYWKGEF